MGSGASSSSSSSDLAESDERNDEDGGDDDDDDGTTPTSHTTGIATDYTSNTHNKRDESHYEDQYESIGNADETCTLEYFGSYDVQQRPPTPRRDRYQMCRSVECVETTLTGGPAYELRESGGSSDSANSLDDLCGRRAAAVGRIAAAAAAAVANEDARFDRHEATNNNARDHYMVPTRDPRELNERILSLFNPQFLPNFNDMITYAAARSPPPPRPQSTIRRNGEDDDILLRSASYRKRGGDANSMCFRRGLSYEMPRK